MELVWPFAWLLLPLPFLLRRYMKPAAYSANGALRVPFYHSLANVNQHDSRYGKSKGLRFLLLSIIWLLLVAALARPAYVGEVTPLPREGRDLMLAIDLSGSMGREDFTLDGRPVTRLDVVKDAAEDFIARRVGDRLGLILFGDRAYLQAPLTFDRTIVSKLLREPEVGLTGQKTAIGDAIAVATKRLRDRPADSRVLVLLTDGANTAGVVQPLDAARLAKDFGIRIYTIGVGAGAMAVDTFLGRQIVDPSQDLDEASLQKIADITGGRYFRAKNVQGLASIYAELDRLEPVDGDPQTVRPLIELFYWPLGGALMLTFLLATIMLLPRYAYKSHKSHKTHKTHKTRKGSTLQTGGA